MSTSRVFANSTTELTSCELETAVHGKCAVELAQSRDLDTILMACQMPIKDGFTAAR